MIFSMIDPTTTGYKANEGAMNMADARSPQDDDAKYER